MDQHGWKYGDLAMVKCSDGDERTAHYRPASSTYPARWTFGDGSYRYVSESEARPILVLDPDDSAQMLTLVKEYCDYFHLKNSSNRSARHDHLRAVSMADAVRKMISPPVTEPTDPAVRLVDQAGTTWARIGTRWVSRDGANYAWDALLRRSQTLTVES